ncbi:hypothetical protein [Pararhodobacter oceanensis]|uniref:Uncharacterized protein n=1 Tax=Pararhodobacter oceanensis TaxID=2172121 RepID=A0A2T8HP66_9RHOB|nr:hypothetical protein [Pararhodobacter oceanensis]PVH27225.1 hypothetical protein DDE20_18720 [Pararhodobacter oceanensis]
MAITNLIDLIAEVAANRLAKEAKTKTETPEQAWRLWDFILKVASSGSRRRRRPLEFLKLIGIVAPRRLL